MAKRRPSREKRTLRYSDRDFSPTDWLRFIQLSPFERAWKELKLDDDALRALEIGIMADPTRAPVEPDTGGMRKFRFAPASWNIGKSGAARVYYVYFAERGVVILLHAYRKTKDEVLSKGERNSIRKLIAEVQQLFDEGTHSHKAKP